MKSIEKTFIWRLMDKLMSAILIASSGCLVIVIAIAVFMRYVMNSVFYGSEDLLVVLAIWLYWIGGAYGSFEDSHISADMTNLFIRNDKIRHYYKIIVRAVTAVLTAVFAYWSISEYAIGNIMSGALTTTLRIPKVTSQIAMTIGLCLMFLYSVYYFIREIHPIKETGPSDEKGGEDAS